MSSRNHDEQILPIESATSELYRTPLLYTLKIRNIFLFSTDMQFTLVCYQHFGSFRLHLSIFNLLVCCTKFTFLRTRLSSADLLRLPQSLLKCNVFRPAHDLATIKAFIGRSSRPPDKLRRFWWGRFIKYAPRLYQNQSQNQGRQPFAELLWRIISLRSQVHKYLSCRLFLLWRPLTALSSYTSLQASFTGRNFSFIRSQPRLMTWSMVTIHVIIIHKRKSPL